MLRSTFAGFTTAYLGLNASHRALEVTGQNIANVNTEGYTRQRLDIKSLNLKSGEFYNNSPNAKIGFGVEITGVSRIRDPFLDVQYRVQMAKLGTADAHSAGYEKLANVLDETIVDGIKTGLNNLNSQLQSLAGHTDEKEYDSMVRSSMQSLLDIFHQKAQQLGEVREDMVTEFEDTTVKDLNEVLKNIAQLNETIKNSHLLGNPALELMDDRDLLLDELSSYLPIDVDYKDQEVAPGVTVDVLDVYFTDTNGEKYTLVSDNKYGRFEADTFDDHDVRLWINGVADTTRTVKSKTVDITENIENGVLKGQLDMMNKSGGFDNPDTDVRGLGYYEKSLDAMVAEFAKTFNELNAAVDVDAETGEVKYMPQFVAGGTTDPQYIRQTDADGNEVTNSKGQYIYIQATDDTGALLIPQADYDAAATKYTPATDVDGSILYEDEPIYVDRPLLETMDGSDTFTASNIQIASAWNKGEYGVTTSTVPVPRSETDANGNEVTRDVIGSTANENVLKMIEQFNAAREFTYDDGKTFYTGNFYGAYTNMENVLGIDQKAGESTLENRITVVNQISDSRDSVSAVSLDEEGIHLLQYQQSYTAAARLMTTLDEALNTLINNTGVVGR